MQRLALAGVLTFFAFAPPAAHAQASSGQKLSFEVTSIKPLNARPARPEDKTLGCHGTDSHSPGIKRPG